MAGSVYEEPHIMGGAASQPLDVFCDNLTLRARRMPFSWHPEYAADIARAHEILARRYEVGRRQRQKCNPVFLDADGVERQPALEGAVVALVQGEAPAPLHGRIIVALDFEALMAGVDVQALAQWDQAIQARYPSAYRFEDLDRDAGLRMTLQRHLQERAEWERGNAAFQRLQAVLVALASASEPAILFIDRLHRLLGGDWQHYPIDMAPVLKPLLHRRAIQLWGACTLEEYQHHVERDASMQRCFQEVCLPTVRTLRT
jgi:ATP-dependent Clp protease ATP-binding subunit ClpA